jgi:hypothetical protein
MQLFNFEKSNITDLSEDISQTKLHFTLEEGIAQDTKRALKDYSLKLD